MKKAIASISLITPYCQGRYHATAKKNKELAEDYERRTWQERLHYDSETKEVFIPALSLANSLKEAAKFISVQIPGKGKSTYTKHFEAGVAVLDDIYTGRTIDEVKSKEMFVPSDGRRGGGSRVMKIFPLILPPLSFQVTYEILDDVITSEVFAYHLAQAGSLIGIGSFRVRNNGVFGRYKVEKIDWIDESDGMKLPPIFYPNAVDAAA